ncbi:efflux RND transporter periplasmic adaptor subunit [Polaromonas glacialis]|uniref:efflux RND transporter periplasmic adaptor subunit n=1 Tax=Polaromonas glacialis TaxID=866564 RepID=UPI000B1CDC34|nr:HlyD family secretion protein [Polaromonas glacialis]
MQEKASADAGLQAAQANLAGAGQDVARQRAERAALAQQRGNVRLQAPADGVVTGRDAEAGSTVVAGQPVLRLIDPASLWVRLRLDQGRSAGLAPGLSAHIVLRSQPRTPLAGQVARVELLADSVTEERIAQVALTPLVELPGLRSVNWPKSRCNCTKPPPRCCCPTPASSASRVRPASGGWTAASRSFRRCSWARTAWMARCRC